MALMSDDAVESVRAFNRFYTRRIGVLDRAYLHSRFSLAEVRVLYELAHRSRPAASDIGRDLGLDAGYLSRMLLGFRKQGLLERRRSAADPRRQELVLTPKGRKTFAPLEAGARNQVADMLRGLAPADRRRLAGAMRTIEELLGGRAEPAPPYVLRPHKPGDIGFVIHRHGALYAEEYGWSEEFEALVAEIGAKFLRKFDARRERCWIAERGGQIVGSVFLVKKTSRIAKLRLLLVEPEARGLGIGRALVQECIAFARQAGYRRITLWTNSVLVAARRIYEQAGFRLLAEEPFHGFGHDLVGQTWELDLAHDARFNSS